MFGVSIFTNIRNSVLISKFYDTSVFFYYRIFRNFVLYQYFERYEKIISTTFCIGGGAG